MSPGHVKGEDQSGAPGQAACSRKVQPSRMRHARDVLISLADDVLPCRQLGLHQRDRMDSGPFRRRQFDDTRVAGKNIRAMLNGLSAVFFARLGLT
jgi:hypothetical protein